MSFVAVNAQVHPARPAQPGTLYHKLISVKQLDPKQFEKDDKLVFDKWFDQTFFRNKISQECYDGIARLSGEPLIPKKMKVKTIPWDFFLDRKSYSKAQMYDRLKYCKGRHFFVKDDEFRGADVEEDLPELLRDGDIHWERVEQGETERSSLNLPRPTEGKGTIEECFEKRFQSLMGFAQDLILPRMKATFRVRAKVFNKHLPDCCDIEDYLEAYANGTYDNEMRALIYALGHNMWGRECFGELEKIVLEILGLEYENVLVTGEKVKTNRRHGNLKKMVTRMRQTYFCERLRKAGALNWQEVIYERNLKAPTDGVVTVIKVTKHTHGYDGYMGIMVGHHLLLTMNAWDFTVAKYREPEPAKEENAAITTYEGPADDSFLEFAQHRSDMKVSDILAIWTARHTPSLVSLGTSASVSTISQSSTLKSPPPTPPATTPTPPAVAPVEVGAVPAAGAVPVDFDVVPDAHAKKSPAVGKSKGKTAPKRKVTGTGASKRTQGARKTSNGAKKRQASSASVVMVTPKKQKRVTIDPGTLSPGEKSPERMSNGNFCVGCDHDDIFNRINNKNIVPCERNYFSKGNLKLNNYPTHCVDCSGSFKSGEPNSVKIADCMKVHCCNNAINHRDHPCVVAWCSPCFGKKCAAASAKAAKASGKTRASSRVRTTTDSLNPGEVRNANGCITAAR